MINEEDVPLLEEAIRLEIHMSEMYLLFSKSCTQDADFWRQLSYEERNHAALLESVQEYFESGLFSEGVVFDNLPQMREANKTMIEMAEKYKKEPPSSLEALEAAQKLELTAQELHFQKTMTGPTESKAITMLRSLNSKDKDHAKRICELLKQYKSSSDSEKCDSVE